MEGRVIQPGDLTVLTWSSWYPRQVLSFGALDFGLSRVRRGGSSISEGAPGIAVATVRADRPTSDALFIIWPDEIGWIWSVGVTGA